MAGGGDESDDKTQEPTDKKLEDARKRGDVPMAPEMRHAAMFVAALVVMGGLGTYTIQQFGNLFVRLWGGADDFRMEPDGAQSFATGLFGAVGTALAPILAALFGFAILGGVLQGRPMISWSRVKPKWNKLNPMNGAKRLFGKQAMVEFFKTFAKLCLVAGIGAAIAWPHAATIDRLVGADLVDTGAAASDIVHAMLRPIATLVGALALFDFVWQRRSFMKRMRMSLQEVKDEYKQSEGDPKIKAKIRSMQMQRSRSRMMSNVPKASVVITNPTHYAIALQYDHGSMGAPVVVAKGVDAIALKIREIATEHNIPLVENRPLARALYASAELDQPIPVEHYAAVAEVISYVLRIARGLR
ncbi:flagellar biosynthesis protein FlhB [Sphingomonas sp. ABOLD]|uniref:Flagellar biosynthetic protein FlhB n=1 Tax=Sphingomonas trueperi TaxID=53317 RepID=A0A7X5Y4F8_9SPHN|nr:MULTISPECIES: flagellar biosynthesis protein FlhB [Sphingomonas]NJB99575.1 flagellar biosynthetic protein FlhB [Sphingomonas trueperi]RSV37960.1 flagellar biosynthesis protein FlhB [Sphingomonas sp. ABOLE]RSV41082.1 flagellar biosynthesis protein FlhB [Sphingomonas sp. ABOLD]